ncbi:MAG: Gfo/Idh/MocA family oxidoreductase [Cyclobacteriaceae bacterium]|nr:Gfo/Idh/MocA family oxidoreductase [Cyclobacteriaceae bacterium]
MSENKNNGGMSRRDILKGLATVPAVGGLFYGAYVSGKKYDATREARQSILKEFNIDAGVSTPRMTYTPGAKSTGQKIRLGVIGFGIRGPQLVQASGFATRRWLENMEKMGPDNDRLKAFYEQEDLNIEYTAVCDIFTVKAEEAKDTVDNGSAHGKKGNAKVYKNWEDLVNAPDVDAVIIATPDHWHAPMSIVAAKAGKHVFVEKPMTHKIQETHELFRVIQETGVVFQVGHQHRQTDSYFKAKEIIDKGVLGPISMVLTHTNRNSPNGAWVYPIHEQASPETIDWDMFLGNAPKVPFNKDHFFRWRKYWAYGTGLNGDLMTHEFDAFNQILGMGIPKSAVCSGGVYFFKDGREVPDVMNVALEYPDKNYTFIYSATQANEYSRTNLILGHDASMEITRELIVKPDRRSTRFAEKFEKGIIKPDEPLFSYVPGSTNLDAVTTATERYFAAKGLLYTYRDGVRVDSGHLHIKEWLEAIRGNGKTSCDIVAGYEEAIAAHMATVAHKMGIKAFWNDETKEIHDQNGNVIHEIPTDSPADVGVIA